MISMQRSQPDNTHETDIHAPVEIGARIPDKRAAVDPRLGPRGHWDWPLSPSVLIVREFK
jgi:hypothetical protein